jgi:hypothetical protein
VPLSRPNRTERHTSPGASRSHTFAEDLRGSWDDDQRATAAEALLRSFSAGFVVLAVGACDNDSTESARVFERGCGERVEGELAADWEAEAVSVGPLLFAYLRTLYLDPAAVRQIATPAGRYPPLKPLAA